MNTRNLRKISGLAYILTFVSKNLGVLNRIERMTMRTSALIALPRLHMTDAWNGQQMAMYRSIVIAIIIHTLINWQIVAEGEK